MFLITLFICSSITYLISRLKQMQLLRKNNIPGPSINLWNIIRGQMKEYNNTPNVIWDSKMIETYGPICGYYIGAKPVILVADPNLAKQIQQQQVDNYQCRPRRVPGGINPDPMRAKMLGNLSVPEWRKLRKILSTNFTSNRIRAYTPMIVELIDELMNKLFAATESNTQSVELNIYPMFQELTFQLISQTGFNVHANFSDKPELKAAVEEEFSKNSTSLLTQLILCFPRMHFLQHLRKYFNKSSKSSQLRDLCDVAVKKRMNGGERKEDILQVMLDSTIRTDEEMLVANSILFYETAYETLSACLAFTMHILTINENVQKKVRAEISNYLKENDGQICPQNIAQCKYLGAVIKESLRLYPPQTTFINRSGEEDFVYEKDDERYTIPKGVQVQIALYQMHHAPEFWDEPEVLKPERHLDENKSPAYDFFYQPFGKGHRKCIGYNYTRVVLPLTLANILSKYTFSPSPKTEEELSILFKTATMTPKYGCFGYIKFDPLV